MLMLIGVTQCRANTDGAGAGHPHVGEKDGYLFDIAWLAKADYVGHVQGGSQIGRTNFI